MPVTHQVSKCGMNSQLATMTGLGTIGLMEQIRNVFWLSSDPRNQELLGTSCLDFSVHEVQKALRWSPESVVQLHDGVN